MQPTGLLLFPFILLPGYILIANDREEQQVTSLGSFRQPVGSEARNRAKAKTRTELVTV
jgi:hypothetical protein